MKWIFLSPHLDDAVYSCGGLIHQQVQRGVDVEIWTIFAGPFDAARLTPFAEDIHQRWGTGLQSMDIRRKEDKEACALLGAAPRYFDFQDVIYRYKKTGEAEIIENDDLFRDFRDEDHELKQSIQSVLQQALGGLCDVQLCSPLGIGNHIDHQMVRRAVDDLTMPAPIFYYADFPYVVRSEAVVPFTKEQRISLSKTDVDAWCAAIALYGSQISTFWHEKEEICEEIQPYWQKGGGSSLWIYEQ